MSGLLWRLSVSLLLTLALECPLAYILGKRRMDLALVALVNILTNPIVVLSVSLLTAYTSLPKPVFIIALEGLAILTEGFCYWRCGRNFVRPFLFSLCVNAFSYLCGEGINAIVRHFASIA